MDTWIVVPAAGHSQRFRDAGYTAPKPLLRIDHKGITGRMVDLALVNTPWERITDTVVGFPTFCDNIALSGVPVDRTMGHADTLSQLVGRIPDDHRVLVRDCDVVLSRECLSNILDCQENLVLAVALSSGSSLSRVDALGEPTRISDEEFISEWAIVGARLFRRAIDLRLALRRALLEDKGASMADVCKFISQPWRSVPANDWVDWGTPEALEASGARIVT